VPFSVGRCAADQHDARIGRRVQHHLGPCAKTSTRPRSTLSSPTGTPPSMT
jgi:hypothetical protein